MQDKSIDNALLALRKQIIRGNRDGLEHVEALLRLRGVDMPRVLPAKRSDVARRGHMTLLILDILRDGPKTLQEVAARVAEYRPESADRAFSRTAQALSKMKAKGLVGYEGRV
ncbi:hypothetical protein [Aquicoccus sp. SU-CL01552]|uniref:hypothetical protein n=1 Tax=Aquicoccus sp. SU-CL01552 TaxID=3127656 RepID=UPI00310BCCED